ncbi:MAG: dihydroxyacetone kinase phosphoryl donor subunit DhaM [Propioniciclava sp.]
MIGIVVVSHSHAVAGAAIGLAAEMVPPDQRPTVLPAAGLDEHTFGTDAAAISEAITQADAGDGVLVLLDLGSAVLSAEMAVEFLDPDLAARVRLSAAPLVEGLVAAVVTAATGADLEACAHEAESGLIAKAAHMGADGSGIEPTRPGAAPSTPVLSERAPSGLAPAESGPDAGTDRQVLAVTVDLPHGLHARPGAAVVSALADISARVLARNATAGSEPIDARSVTGLGGLDLRRGDLIEFVAEGADAPQAIAALAALVADGFGEVPAGEPAPLRGSGVPVEVRGPAALLPEPDLSAYRPGADEQARLADARAAVHSHLELLADGAAPELVGAWVALLADRAFLPIAERALESGASATDAVQVAVSAAGERFARLPDPYLQARGEDIRGLGRLLLTALVGADLRPSWPQSPFVAVAAELDLAMCLSLDPEVCAGVVTWAGSALGHGAILARQLRIPYQEAALWAREVRADARVSFTVSMP